MAQIFWCKRFWEERNYRNQRILNNNFDVSFEKKEEKSTKEKAEKPEILVCPKCKKGKMIKGKTAWGCSAYKEGCTFIIPFEMLQKSYNSEILTKKVLDEIVSGNKKLFWIYRNELLQMILEENVLNGSAKLIAISQQHCKTFY